MPLMAAFSRKFGESLADFECNMELRFFLPLREIFSNLNTAAPISFAGNLFNYTWGYCAQSISGTIVASRSASTAWPRRVMCMKSMVLYCIVPFKSRKWQPFSLATR